MEWCESYILELKQGKSKQTNWFESLDQTINPSQKNNAIKNIHNFNTQNVCIPDVDRSVCVCVFECVSFVCEPFEYFPILISLIFDRHRRCRRCRRSLHSRRIKAIQTASRSDIKANGILLNCSKPTECSLRMHVNLGWIPSCIYFMLGKCIPFFGLLLHFSAALCYGPFLLPFFYNKKKENLYCSGFFPFAFELKPFDPVCVCSYLPICRSPLSIMLAVYIFVYESVFVFADPKNS